MITIAQPKQQARGVTKVFPGLSEDQSNWIYDQVSKMGISDPSEMLNVQQEIYKQVHPVAQQRKAESERADAKNEMFNKGSKDKKSQEAINFRFADFADQIKKEKGLAPTAPDDKVLEAFIKENPDMKPLVVKHINEGDKELLYQLGIEEKPLINKALGTARDVALGTAASVLGGSLIGGALQATGKLLYGSTIKKSQTDIEEGRKFRSGVMDEHLNDSDAAWENGKLKSEKPLKAKKPVSTIDTGIDAPLIQSSGRGKSRVGLMGSKTAMGDQAEARKVYLSKSVLDPVFQKMDQDGIRAKYNSLRRSIVGMVDSQGDLGPNDKKLLAQEINDIFDENYSKGDVSMSDLNKESNSNFRRLPKNKQGQAELPITKRANFLIGKGFRDFVSKNAAKYGENLPEVLREYHNLDQFVDIGRKADATPMLGSGGPLGLVSNVFKAVATPATTIPGKLIYKVGKFVDYIPKQIRVKSLTALKNIGKGFFALDPINTPEILKLLPGTIGDSFEEYVNTNPGSVALKALMESGKSEAEIIEEMKVEFPGIDDDTARDVIEGKLIVL